MRPTGRFRHGSHFMTDDQKRLAPPPSQAPSPHPDRVRQQVRALDLMTASSKADNSPRPPDTAGSRYLCG